MARLGEVVSYLDRTLGVSEVRDTAHNGLQVEGRPEVHRVVTGVSANLALLEAARARNADLVVVHHGLVWGGITRVVGPLRRRLKVLLENDMSLAAYHLPLDMHPELGNNAQLARALGLAEVEPFGHYKGQVIGLAGKLGTALGLDEFVARVRLHLGQEPTVLAGGSHPVERVAICSGGAPHLVEEAIEKGCDLYLTGEATESTPAMAEEGAIHVVAAGHHATERFGVRALAAALAERFGLECEFVDVANRL